MIVSRQAAAQRVDASEREPVVLVDESGRAIGTADKAAAHHRRTPLHLGVSCYVFDRLGRVLLTRRADTKATWPGVWSNSVCGHPVPGESLDAAIRRRAGHELGLRVDGVRLLLPAFRYRAAMADGTAENELCPVLAAATADEPAANPTEVSDHFWLPWETVQAYAGADAPDLSPWFVAQVRQFTAVGADPRVAPEADRAELPPAVRLRG